MLTGLAILLLGLLVAVGISWLALTGMMRLAFQRVRMVLRRLVPRRATERPEQVDRRRDQRTDT